MAESLWRSCRSVQLRGNTIHCELTDTPYDLADAYQGAPHLQFSNCSTDDDLVAFVHTWGPLRLKPQEQHTSRVSVTLQEYWAWQKLLRSIHHMLDSCRHNRNERESLAGYFAAWIDAAPTNSIRRLIMKDFAFDIQRSINRLVPPGFVVKNPMEWATSGNILLVRRVLAQRAEMATKPPRRYGLRVEAKTNRFEIKPSFELEDLWSALQWMVFYDEWNARPPTLCKECPRIFRARSANQTKYCSPTCAHRATNREWRRRDLREHGKRTIRSKGAPNGPRKTR
jgi:hypothetical protein